MQRPQLAPVLARTIAHGPNAGRLQPITDIVLDGITAAREIAIKLKRNGFTVINCIVGNGLPTVQVASCRLTQEMIAADAACYYKHSTVGGIPERHGQFQAEATDGKKVRVVWVERGH